MWLLASILSMREILEHGLAWSFAWIFFNSFAWVKRELRHVYNDCMDGRDVIPMLPDPKQLLQISER